MFKTSIAIVCHVMLFMISYWYLMVLDIYQWKDFLVVGLKFFTAIYADWKKNQLLQISFVS